jgi:hypothetical protein
MFLGHAPSHAKDTYRFLNLETKKVIVSWDVILLGKCYGDWKGITKNNITSIDDDDDSDEEYSMAPNLGWDLVPDRGGR